VSLYPAVNAATDATLGSGCSRIAWNVANRELKGTTCDPLDRLRSSNCNSVTIAFAGASDRAVTYFTLSVGVSLHRVKSIKSSNAKSFACIRIS